MMDLREFLKVLEEEHELQKIRAEVDPKHELGAICKIHNERPNTPALRTTVSLNTFSCDDEGINMADPNEVLWALTMRFQPATDMFVTPRSITSSLEPSAGADGLTSKLMLDPTIKENCRGEVAEPTAKMRQSVLQRWKEYGFK